jgi:hypothetical protein
MNGLRFDLNIEQRDIYLFLWCLSYGRKLSNFGIVAVDNNDPPRYPYKLEELSERTGYGVDLLKETINKLIATKRLSMDENGIMYLTHGEFTGPPSSAANVTVYHNSFNQELKDSIRKRDGHICQRCKIDENSYKEQTGRNLTVHHVNYDKIDTRNENLITLCGGCNAAVNTNSDYWQKVFTDKINAMYAKSETI